MQKETITQNIDGISVDSERNQYSDKYMRLPFILPVVCV